MQYRVYVTLKYTSVVTDNVLLEAESEVEARHKGIQHIQPSSFLYGKADIKDVQVASVGVKKFKKS